MNKILVTGAAGFIGLNFIKKFNALDKIVVVDNFTYASNPKELQNMDVEYQVLDISNADMVAVCFQKYKFTHVIHFAAESHVDNSIKNCMPFINSNIIGTVNLLEQSVKHNVEMFLHISTDEVFGAITDPNKFNEQSPISPQNPYSASKASAENFVVAYGNTYKLPYIIINSSNNYGPWQHKEKLIPKTIINCLHDIKIPVYGNGKQIRDWLYVEDTAEIIETIFYKGKTNQRYCIGGDMEISNIELVKIIIDKLSVSSDIIQYVTDRLGHDIRYSTDIEKVRLELGWSPKTSLNDGLDKTIEWYKNENLRRIIT